MSTTSEPPVTGVEARTDGLQVDRRWVTRLSILNLGLFMAFVGPLAVLLPDQVQMAVGERTSQTAFGTVAALGALVAMVSSPLAGAMSDSAKTKRLTRRPWIRAGAIMGAVALYALSVQKGLAGILVFWCLAQLGLNVLQSASSAVVPDRVPVNQRGVVSAWIGASQSGAVIIAVAIATLVKLQVGYLLFGCLVFLLSWPFDDRLTPPLTAATNPATPESAETSTKHRPHVSGSRDFRWVLLTRLLVNLGNAMGVQYLLYFLRFRLSFEAEHPGYTAEDGLFLLLSIYTVVAVASALIGGRLSDHTGKRRWFVMVAGVIMAVPAFVLAAHPTWPVTIVSAVVLGFGYGIYLAVDQALVTQVLPDAAKAGKDLGIINLANTAPQTAAPALAALLVSSGGYSALYTTVGAVTLAASGLIWMVRSVR